MSLIDKKDTTQKNQKPKAKFIALVVGAAVSLSAIGGTYFFVEKKQGEQLPVADDQAQVSSLADYADLVKTTEPLMPRSSSPQSPIKKENQSYSQDELDKVSFNISKRFFGGRLVEYIEYNKESGLYALIPSGSSDVYFVNRDETVVIKGDAYLVSNSSATLINDLVKESHKESFKGGVDVLSLVGGDSNTEKKELPEMNVVNNEKTIQAEQPQQKSDSNDENKNAVDGVDKKTGLLESATPKNKTEKVDGDVLDKLANGETVRPVREPTQDELDEIKTKTEEESAKILFGQKLKDDYLLVYNPPEGVRTVATINVFADPECPSCKKLHNDMDKLLSLGVKVRYIAMPRKGLDSPIAKQMAVAFCSPNKQSVFDSLFNGKRYDTDVDGFDSCFSLVSKNANLGYSLGIKHTPTIYSSDTGKIFEGYPSGSDAYINLLDQIGVTSLLGKNN